MKRTEAFNQKILDHTKKWAPITEQVIEKVADRRKVKRSVPGKLAKIRVQRVGDNVDAEIAFRTTLRFLDMGSGRGYTHGHKINSVATKKRSYYRVGMKQFDTSKKRVRRVKTRRPKKITTRPIYARIHDLQEVMMVTIADETVITIRENLT